MTGVALSGLVLAASGCARPTPQPPEPHVRAIVGSETATVTVLEPTYTPRPTATPTFSEGVATIVADTSLSRGTGLSVEDVQGILEVSFAALQGDYNLALARAYEPPSGSWSIQHPDGWTIDVAKESDSGKTRLAGQLGGPKGQAFVAAEVKRVRYDRLSTLYASTEDVVLPDLALLDDFRLLSRSTQFLRGTFVEELVFSHNSPLGPAIALMIVARSNSDLYTVRGETASPEFDHVEDQIRAIVYSFRTPYAGNGS